MWILGTILGSFSLVVQNWIGRTYALTINSFFVMSIVSLIVTWSYWFGFNKGPNFLVVWFIGSVLAAIGAGIVQIFVLYEPVTWGVILGYPLILVGGILVRFL